MLPTAEILKQWKADLDLDPILDWIRCYAHLFTDWYNRSCGHGFQ